MDEDQITDLNNIKRELVIRSNSENIARLTPQIQNDNRNDYFSLLCEKGLLADKERKNYAGLRRIYKAYAYFSNAVDKYIEELNPQNDNDKINALFELVRRFNSAVLVSIEVETNKDAYMLFESLKDIKLDKLNIHDIENWKQEMNSKNLTTRTKNDLMKYLKSALNYGTKWYDFNFTSMYNKMVNFTNSNEMPKEMLFYTYEEFKKFISVEEDLKFKTLFETLYFCGLRRGELRGLTWKYVDFERKEIRVVKNVVNVKGDSGYWHITTPKTKSSIRQIPIPNTLFKDLKSLKEESKKYYGFNDDWFVFGDVSRIHPDVLRKRKKGNAEKSGLKEIRIHDFRHSCASLLINNGANIVMVAKYLGHTKIDETLNTYSHMFRNKLDDIVNTIDKLDE